MPNIVCTSSNLMKSYESRNGVSENSPCAHMLQVCISSGSLRPACYKQVPKRAYYERMHMKEWKIHHIKMQPTYTPIKQSTFPHWTNWSLHFTLKNQAIFALDFSLGKAWAGQTSTRASAMSDSLTPDCFAKKMAAWQRSVLKALGVC